MQCGQSYHPEVVTLAGGRLGMMAFPALVGLFIHPDEGPILFDTGYEPALIEATKPFPHRFYRWLTPPIISRATSVDARLARLGLTVGDVRWVMLSHFHADHIAGLHLFPSARIACSRQGLDAARRGSDWSALLNGVLRRLIPGDIDTRLVFFEDRPWIALPHAFRPFETGADMFGDGSLVAVELPGHCPGHWGLAARGADDRLHFLAADAAWSSRAIRENRPPPRLMMALLNETKPYRRTLEMLHRMCASAPDMLVTPAHCIERAADIAAESVASTARNDVKTVNGE
jgi:glyoxylase-like metal-dependent hydrolase (beta-lactamase superfamily II)